MEIIKRGKTNEEPQIKVCPDCVYDSSFVKKDMDEIDLYLYRFNIAKEVITNIRKIRQNRNISKNKILTLEVVVDENYPKEFASIIEKVANVKIKEI
jgi:valyl-tRNA synthetase